jgi:DnaJ-domain-containing protein 1
MFHFGGPGGFPGGFPGMDGGDNPFGGGGPRGSQQRDVDTESYYKLLELEKGCSDADIKKAYKKLCRKHHPDKGGREVNTSY